MKLSFVIPAYNCGSLLYKGLEYLAHQDVDWFHSEHAELIIIDDGSTDDTYNFIEKISTLLPKLKYIYRPRDEHSGRSCARNLGLQRSSGEYVCFLDAGMLVPNHFVSRILELYEKSPEAVTLHSMYGIDLDPSITDTSVIEKVTPNNIHEMAIKLAKLPVWNDRREPFFRYMRDDIQQLALPWELGYSGAITVPSRIALSIGGFDETYKGWGVEDIDFAYRLHQAGVIFRSDRQAYAIHYPHGSNTAGNRQGLSDNQNRIYMHSKFRAMDTELLPEYQGHFYNVFIEKMNNLILPKHTAYPTEQLERMAERIKCSATSLLIGTDDLELAKYLNTSHMYVHSRQTLELFRGELPLKVIEYSLGLRSFLPDRTFEVCIVTDLIRMLHPDIRVKLLKELTRISKEVILLLSADSNAPENAVLADNLKEQAGQKKEGSHEEVPSKLDYLQFNYVRSPRIRHVMEPYFWCERTDLEFLLGQLKLEQMSDLFL